MQVFNLGCSKEGRQIEVRGAFRLAIESVEPQATNQAEFCVDFVFVLRKKSEIVKGCVGNAVRVVGTAPQ